MQAETEDEKNKALRCAAGADTNVQFANDEDPGMGLELGLDAFSEARPCTTLSDLLGVGYDLLDRDEFATILHRPPVNRVKGPHVVMFNK